MAAAGPDAKILGYSELDAAILRWRGEGKSLVFTNGCFDILHRGHVELLRQASRFGDILIVGINSDRSVRSLKGDRRPIIDEESRASVIAAMEFVDAVILFDEASVESLVRRVRPDCLVKGGEYRLDQVVGAAFAGRVEIVAMLDEYSTTRIVEKVLALHGGR
jgi:D-beta-D-heptose 7-phosphate kinase/D-beta-D-heptose 1-phosphate adenosyltransferase